jgi:predicted aspartyl protease
MIERAKSFTAKAQGIARVLMSDCGICPAHDPLSGIPHPKVEKFNAIWDTGATGTVITKKVVDTLGLKPVSKTKVRHANGEAIVNVYYINLFLPNQVAFNFIPVTEGVLGDDASVLIGMDVITKGDFAVTNFNGKTTFSFRVPSLAEIDFNTDVVAKESKPIVNTNKSIGRNDMCHCGSGKKYKHCHGK